MKKRRFVVATVDGAWHRSDWITDSELQEVLDANDGHLGQDFKGRDVYVDSVDEAMDFMTTFLKYDTSLDNQVFSMDINGTKRHFNVCHIMHWQIDVVDTDAWDV